jgi:hypothetical protein
MHMQIVIRVLIYELLSQERSGRMKRGEQKRNTRRDTRKDKEMVCDDTQNTFWRQGISTPGSWCILSNALSRYTYLMRAVISTLLAHDKG